MKWQIYLYIKYIKIFYFVFLNHVYRILLHCNGFTKIQDIIKLIAQLPESTIKSAKYTVSIVQNFIKPNIKSFYFFFQNMLTHSNRILLHCNGFTEFQDLTIFTVQIPHSNCLTISHLWAKFSFLTNFFYHLWADFSADCWRLFVL